MFTEKATVEQLQHHEDVTLDTFRNVWEQLRKIQRTQDRFANDLTRYSLRLTSVMQDLENSKVVVDHNAQQGENANGKIREAFERCQELKTAVELLAENAGVEITVLEEVPTTVTIHPGLPARLGLQKETKKGVMILDSQELPSPLELVAEANTGLQLVR